MKRFALCMTVAGALIAGCSEGESSASSGISTEPKGERIGIPSAPQGGGTAETRPDPGDANDHSNPQHDARSGKGGG